MSANDSIALCAKIILYVLVHHLRSSKLSEVPKNFNCAIINLSLLNSNLIKLINKSGVQEIIIINYNMNDFWNKIKL
jgi:hypothetical protein